MFHMLYLFKWLDEVGFYPYFTGVASPESWDNLLKSHTASVEPDLPKVDKDLRVSHLF